MTRFNQVTYTPPSSSSSSFSSVLSSSPASSPSPLSSFGPSPASSSSSSRSSSLVSSNSSRSFPPSRSNSFSSSSSSSSVSSSSSSLPLPPPSAQFPNLGTITLGTGLTWDVVYARLEALGLGLNVAGGRIPGIGEFLFPLTPNSILFMYFFFKPSRRRRVHTWWRVLMAYRPIWTLDRHCRLFRSCITDWGDCRRS